MATQKQSEKMNKRGNIRDIFNKYQESREGTFQEARGGGTPIPKGEKLENHPELKNKRVMQPRDDDGQFTYNAVNNIPLKYGPSRGKTVPPLFTGMKMNFVTKKKTAVVLGGLTYLANIEFTVEKFMEMLNDFSIDGKNGKVIFNNLPLGEMVRKKGRKSQSEKDMISRGESGFTNPDAQITNRGVKSIAKKKETTQAEQPKGGNEGNTPQQPQQPKIDTELAKSNPVEFGKKYQKEISNIKKIDPKISEAKIINAFASGKIESFDDLEHALNLKNNKK